MFTALFLKDAAERAVATFAQSLIGVYGADQLIDLTAVSTIDTFTIAGIAAGVAVLKAIVSAQARAGTGPAV